tara:strand:- start:117 stop:353 length:237 start_codon:yes stop_codon:yes gene_type:complete
MYSKIANALSIASFVLVVSSLGSAFFGYKYIQSPQFQKKIMDKVLKEIQPLMGDVLGNAMPDVTGPSLPIPSKPKLIP